MDKAALSGLILIIGLVVVVAGVMVFNSMNPNTSGVINPVIGNDNQTGVNNTNDNISSPNTLLTLIPFSWSNSQSNPSPGPSPTPIPDPMDQIISLFDAYVKSTFPQTGIPGSAVVIVKDDKIIYMNCLGLRDVASGAPVDKNTLFEIASCTKAFSATNVAQLVDQGLLSWNDTITKYYPDPSEFKLYNDYVTGETTIFDVLVQRVGYPPNSGDEFTLFNYTNFDENLYKMRYFKNTSEFRTTFTYNGIMYSLAGECAARAKNTTWSELIKKDLLEPLNMNSATTTYNDFINSPNRIHTYIHIDDTLQEREPLHTANEPAGAICSSIEEIANWLAFQIRDDGTYQGTQIVSKENLDLTRTGHIYSDNTNTTMYGLGWNVKSASISHCGSEYYSNSLVSIIPSQKLGIAVFTNEGTFGLAFDNALMMKLSYLLMGDTSTDPWPALRDALIPKPPLPPYNGTPIGPKILSTYTGIYSNAILGNITITNDNDTLFCNYGDDRQSFKLTHWNEDVFIEKNYNQPFNFTDISNGSAHQLTTDIKDYTSTPLNSAVFNRTNST